jgi:hypothetical protein
MQKHSTGMDAVSARYLHQNLLSLKESLQLSSLLKYRLAVFTKNAKD